MSSDTAIELKRLSKAYRILHRTERATTIAEAVSRRLRGPFLRRPKAETFWALKDVTATIKRGEVIGIIGRNGAGKTTLLKILSRITEPSSGEARIWGRVGSLLEVGTGFHPELSGRENIYLSGAVLGMKRGEIAERFNAIVEFAEVAAFLDTPIKRYSSGMFTRLAFSVAAHLQPDVLIVDEVLAVGDAAFQRRCLSKMEEVGQAGRTVLFVSHNIAAITRLCSRAILLERGRMTAVGNSHEVASLYLRSESGNSASRVWTDSREAPGDSVAQLRSVRILNDRDEIAGVHDIRRSIFVEVAYWQFPGRIRALPALQFFNEDGTCLFSTVPFREGAGFRGGEGLVLARCRIPGNFLAEGSIYVFAAVVSYNPDCMHAGERDAVSFQVVDKTHGEGVRGEFAGSWPGVLRPMLDWQLARP